MICARILRFLSTVWLFATVNISSSYLVIFLDSALFIDLYVVEILGFGLGVAVIEINNNKSPS